MGTVVQHPAGQGTWEGAVAAHLPGELRGEGAVVPHLPQGVTLSEQSSVNVNLNPIQQEQNQRNTDNKSKTMKEWLQAGIDMLPKAKQHQRQVKKTQNVTVCMDCVFPMMSSPVAVVG